MFNKEQKEILSRSKIKWDMFLEQTTFDIVDNRIAASSLDDFVLTSFIKIANALYRGGQQLISDHDYDFIFLKELEKRNPNHSILKNVEPESAFKGKTVNLPMRMLSTEKAYSHVEILNWSNRIKKVANDNNIEFDYLIFRVTPKLDGFAAYDDGNKLYTRGNGIRGTDITRVFERGLNVANNGARGLGPGEIVVSKKYFTDQLSTHFENARNFQSSVVKEKSLDSHAAKAIKDKAAVFYPFRLLPAWEGLFAEFALSYEKIIDEIWTSVDYDVDGVIIEVCNEQLKELMGATRHHNRWQIAYKKNVDNAIVKILKVTPQTSRSGRVNPVAEIEPTRLSGAIINRATAHHYGMVQAKGIGHGAVIELTRSGEVIPKIVKVISSVIPEIPSNCPSCNAELTWESDYLYCTNNIECPAQVANSIEHFFKTLGNIDGFGAATIDRFYKNGIRSVIEVYEKTINDFIAMGFGPKQSENLANELHRSKLEKIEDWRFLAAFGIFRMGGGNCENLLSNYRITEIFDLNIEQIIAIEGFAEKTAEAVIKGFKKIHPLFESIYSLGFNLETSKLLSEAENIQSPIKGKLIVFTGTMIEGSRKDMETEAKKLGAKVGSSVSSKTDYLVTGDNVGTTKIVDARKNGVTVLTEEQYIQMLADNFAA